MIEPVSPDPFERLAMAEQIERLEQCCHYFEGGTEEMVIATLRAHPDIMRGSREALHSRLAKRLRLRPTSIQRALRSIRAYLEGRTVVTASALRNAIVRNDAETLGRIWLEIARMEARHILDDERRHDAEGAAVLALCQAQARFDPSRAGGTQWAKTVARNAVVDVLRRDTTDRARTMRYGDMDHGPTNRRRTHNPEGQNGFPRGAH